MKKTDKTYLPLEDATAPCEGIRYKIFGSGPIEIVIELGLASSAGEWWHIAEKLSQSSTVLLYERLRKTTPKRTPQNIANELYLLIKQLECKNKVIIIAHSQGGLYAQQFARVHPDMVRGLILIDPLSANDSLYKEKLTLDEQKKSGFDKTANLVIMEKLCKLHLGFAVKALMKNAPPFYYYKDFSKNASGQIMSSLANAPFHSSALEEYRLAHDENEIKELKTRGSFPNIPIALITHSSEFEIKEIMEFGRADRACAQKVETLWQSLMAEYLQFSDSSKHITAKNSGHYIHLTEPNLIIQALEWINSN